MPTGAEQRRHKLLSRYRGNGLLGVSGDYTLWTGTGPDAATASLRDELVDRGDHRRWRSRACKGPRFVVAEELPMLDAEREVARRTPAGRAGGPARRFLAPLDPLAWDRDLLLRLFGFDYRWEVYVPAAKRRWGYYVLPLLYGDRLVGRIEPRIDRKAGTLRIIGSVVGGWASTRCDADPGLRRRVRGGDARPHGVRGPHKGGDAQGGEAS